MLQGHRSFAAFVLIRLIRAIRVLFCIFRGSFIVS
jgi:hypothetical protein